MREDTSEPRGAKPSVLIVCDNDETILGLRDYLSCAGLEARATRNLTDAWRKTASVDALVLFPDDFDTRDVIDGAARLSKLDSSTFVVVVTGDSQSFESVLRSMGNTRAVVMAKPVWGWTILDLLRGALEAGP